MRCFMNKIWEFFENLNELVYVSDMDSYELIYMNKKALKKFGLNSCEDLKGKKCYKVLQGCKEPCAICCNSELVPGYFKEWKYYNPILSKHFMLKDTVIEEGGRRYRIEIAMDVSAQEKQSGMLHSYQNLEMFVNETIRLALRAPDPDKTIEIILECLGQKLNGERTYIFEKNKWGGDDNTYEWVANGVTSEKDSLQNLPAEVCENWYRHFSEDRNIVIEDLEEIREDDPLQYENLKRQNIHSIAVVPLYDDDKTIGFYGVDNPPVHNLDYATDMLQIMGHFMVSTLRRRNLVKQLREMSCYDQLTNLGNRHAMSEYVSNMSSGKSLGVVYCDVTGLKHVNDTEGHGAGDRLICRAAECLKKALGNYGLFRIGGDELLALCMQIEENELYDSVDKLKRIMKENSVTMAVGAVWHENGTEGVQELMTIAEKLMYADKAEYYETLGIDRRKR